ncbi:MAG: 16S rRNA (adenine(1518)-N(6)/adenine(1519)-N(6))-dimethyltransferase RsmA [Candidatus Pacebacteria bacterium]|jgi:16S rRNA (adenine1518-N6/adenine1519-N6)-dimethyltransferase|nr:16S rRNA (adenine(1518)-N(6)/adenine(1519)-N(6))-dimethyltransferase RsmA [Candidatus Paceibacterota bacterium]
MNLLQKTLELCQLYGIKPSRSKGQNFLIEEEVYDRIVDSANIKKEDTVLEVGPGLGFLTLKLGQKAKKVLAVELDTKIFQFLQVMLQTQKIENIKVFNNDILQAKGEKFSKMGKYKIVSNLPYNITSVFLRKFLSLSNKPELIVLMLQKEVAQRIVAQAPDMSLLSASVQFYAQAEILFEVNRDKFYPAPEVDSAVIRIKPIANRLKNYEEEKKFFSILKIGFSAKRKMLKNNLSLGLKMDIKEIENILNQASLDSKVRAEELTIDNWLNIYRLVCFL